MRTAVSGSTVTSLPVSVVVIARNAAATIGQCLASVQRNRPAEIVVIDGGSTDGTPDISRRFGARVYPDRGRGKSFARQLGAEEAKGEYLAYVDADVTLEDGALAAMLGEIEQSGFAAVSCRQRLAPGSANYWGRASMRHTEYSHRRTGGEFLGTMACLLRRETVLAAGFDAAAGGCDDRVFEARLRAAGGRLGVSRAAAYHHHRLGLGGFVRYRFFLGRLAPGYLRRYGPFAVRFWPPLVAGYWIFLCIRRGELWLVPYFAVNGTAQTAGLFWGLVSGEEGH
jgi:glycosyltransferase involved in cell wall biosynthesis